jgi:hypothetical protein
VAGYSIDPADVGSLIATLAAVEGLDQVWVDGVVERPAQVVEIGQPLTLPGVVVQVYGYTFDALDSYQLRGRLLLVVGDAPAPDARPALASLLNLVSQAVPPKGEVTHEAVVLPDRPGAPLPALSVPFVVRCTPA